MVEEEFSVLEIPDRDSAPLNFHRSSSEVAIVVADYLTEVFAAAMFFC